LRGGEVGRGFAVRLTPWRCEVLGSARYLQQPLGYIHHHVICSTTWVSMNTSGTGYEGFIENAHRLFPRSDALSFLPDATSRPLVSLILSASQRGAKTVGQSSLNTATQQSQGLWWGYVLYVQARCVWTELRSAASRSSPPRYTARHSAPTCELKHKVAYIKCVQYCI
jgi:hypothetical protein